MKEFYVYNPRTHKLHISGYCPNSIGPDYETFSSEESAISFHAGQVIFCKACKKKIDSLIRKDKNNKSIDKDGVL